MDKIIPKLELDDRNDEELIEYGKDKSAKINASPAFATVDPSTVTVDAKIAQFETAVIAADDGNKGETAIKNQVRAELELLLTRQAYDCAVIASGNLPLYLTTGYEAKDVKGTPTGELPQVTGLTVSFGDSEGELKASWDPIPKAENFTLQVYTNGDDPEGSLVKEYMRSKIGRKKTVLESLPSTKRVLVRIRANGGSTGHGIWSKPVQIKVP